MEKSNSYGQLQLLSEKVKGKWEAARMELDNCFKSREASRAKPIMEASIQLFSDYLFEANGTNVIEQCELKPVNVSERLEFIKGRPWLYHSYIQLSELFSEQEKLVAKKIALNKQKNKRPV